MVKRYISRALRLARSASLERDPLRTAAGKEAENLNKCNREIFRPYRWDDSA